MKSKSEDRKATPLGSHGVPIQGLDTNEAARIIGCARKTLENDRVRGGGPPYYKIGRAVRYEINELMAWMQSKKRTSTSDSGSI